MLQASLLFVLLIMGILLPMLMAAAFLLGRHLHRRHDGSQELSPVTRQHIELFQGGQLSEAALESTKAHFRDLLERGELAAVEASLRPGMHYVLQVRALAELGTEEAGRILERQLQRRLTADQIEQSWYWIDLACGLRNLNREESLPHLLRCAEKGGDHPLSHFFAAETICFLSFSGYLRQPESPLGLAALKVLHRALEGLRCGVQPHLVAEARLGELIEILWDNRAKQVQPLAVRVFAEALRTLRRAPHAELLLTDEHYEQEAFSWQMSRLAALEPVLVDYLEEAPKHLCDLLANAGAEEQRDLLSALNDLRAEAAAAVLPLLKQPGFEHAESAVAALRWSRDPQVGPWLQQWICQRIPVAQRAQKRRLRPLSRPAPIPADIPYPAVLRALRGHPSNEVEGLLLLAARDCEPTCRCAALSSIGWWEPLLGKKTYSCLQEARRDSNPDVRQAARAALGRLGERQALQWFRQALMGQDSQRVHEAIQSVSQEGLMLLWPDLDRLADSENVDVALHSSEALERLHEELHFRQS
jgi:hypothetical protein